MEIKDLADEIKNKIRTDTIQEVIEKVNSIARVYYINSRTHPSEETRISCGCSYAALKQLITKLEKMKGKDCDVDLH